MVTFMRAERAGAPADAHDAGVLDLDVARERGGVGLHALDRADQPVEQVDVVARLVHERAAVELPGAAPGRAVVVGLRPGPEHVDVDHVDAAEALLLDRALEQLQRGVAAVLLDDEQVHAGLVAGVDHPLAVLPAGGHRLLGHHVAAGRGDLDRLLGVQPARRREDDDVGVGPGQQRVERCGSRAPRSGPRPRPGPPGRCRRRRRARRGRRACRSRRSGWPRSGRSPPGRSGSCGPGRRAW